MRIAIYHNLLWASYKGAVFSELSRLCQLNDVNVSFIQIAETEIDRVPLSAVDHGYHRYTHRLLFRGNYSQIPRARLIAALIKDLYRFPTDLVLIPNYHLAEFWVMLIFCIVTRRKRAVVCEATEFDQRRNVWKEVAKRIFFSFCDGFFCYGLRSRRYLSKYRIDSTKIHLIPQAAAFPADYDPERIIARYRSSALSLDQLRFLYVGRLAPEKGIQDLLSALVLVREGGLNARVDIIGAGKLESELRERIAELHIEGCVRLMGAMDLANIAPNFFSSVALVLPSHSEPWGLVVNEALSYGCPVVVSDRCGCASELVIDGETGFAFSAGNAEALAVAMKSVVGLSHDRVATAATCVDVISRYTPEKAAERMLSACIEILPVEL